MHHYPILDFTGIKVYTSYAMTFYPIKFIRTARSIVVAVLTVGCFSLLDCQQSHPNSPAFKDYKPPNPTALVKPSDVTYELWEGFMLVRSANEGDPASQHELGLRYLLGKGFPVDTVKAAYWIKKAADQNFLPARYNYGIFLNNGWGVPWNPFEAYKDFRYAAEKGMPEAEYVFGIFMTDDLVVQRNWNEAYKWIKKAADAGYAIAKETLAEFDRLGVVTPADSSSGGQKPLPKDTASISASAQPLWQPVFLDFSKDSMSQVDDYTLLKEALREGGPELQNALGVSSMFEDSISTDSNGIEIIRHAANAGSPEALSLLGRCYERGIGVRRNIISASALYIRAIRLDSRRARGLLWRVVQEQDFPRLLESRTKTGNADAEFAWAGLVALGLDNRLTDDQALKLLQSAAEKKNVAAIIELGLCSYSGRWVVQDKKKAIEFWQLAARLGSREAIIRIAATTVFGGTTVMSVDSAITILRNAVSGGSLLAQVALAYCYETGSGLPQNVAEAIKLYRSSAQRGSQLAYSALQKMYDGLRPKDKEFQIEE